MKLSRVFAPAIAGVLAAGLLSACAGEPAALSLVETKSPVQLLRNEAASRLIDGTDDSVEKQEDFSAACKPEGEDPKGLWRSWRSTLLAGVPADSAVGVDQFVGALATSFAEDGWVLKESHDGETSAKTSTMTKSGSIATLKFTSTEDSGDGATMLIESSGPCVLTAGPESDEVLDLETQD